MKRLVADNTESVEKFITDSAKQGRDLLKDLEKFKFKIFQCAQVSQNTEVGDKIKQHSDMLDKLMSGLYSICYDLENINLINEYDNDQLNFSDQDSMDSDNSSFNLNEEIPEENVDEEEVADFDLDSEENEAEEEEEPNTDTENDEDTGDTDTEEITESE